MTLVAGMKADRVIVGLEPDRAITPVKGGGTSEVAGQEKEAARRRQPAVSCCAAAHAQPQVSAAAAAAAEPAAAVACVFGGFAAGSSFRRRLGWRRQLAALAMSPRPRRNGRICVRAALSPIEAARRRGNTTPMKSVLSPARLQASLRSRSAVFSSFRRGAARNIPTYYSKKTDI